MNPEVEALIYGTMSGEARTELEDAVAAALRLPLSCIQARANNPQGWGLARDGDCREIERMAGSFAVVVVMAIAPVLDRHYQRRSAPLRGQPRIQRSDQ